MRTCVRESSALQTMGVHKSSTSPRPLPQVPLQTMGVHKSPPSALETTGVHKPQVKQWVSTSPRSKQWVSTSPHPQVPLPSTSPNKSTTSLQKFPQSNKTNQCEFVVRISGTRTSDVGGIGKIWCLVLFGCFLGNGENNCVFAFRMYT
jgi:hypothetical protein